MRKGALALLSLAACVPSGGLLADGGSTGISRSGSTAATASTGATASAGTTGSAGSSGGSSSGGGDGYLVATFAGSGRAGDADGPAGQAQFDGPVALAFDSQGVLFVAERSSGRIRKIDATGTVTTVQTGATAPFFGPQAIAVDAAGNIYVADTPAQCVEQIDPSGNVIDFAGLCSLPDAGTAECADVAEDDASQAGLNAPTGLALDLVNGLLYIADAQYDDLIRVANLATGTLLTVAGNNGSAFYDGACGVNCCCGNYWGSGFCAPSAVSCPLQEAAFRAPSGLALAPDGGLLVADTGNCAVRLVSDPTDAGCAVSTLAGNGACNVGNLQPGDLDAPQGVAPGPNGTVYVADTARNRLVLIDPSAPTQLQISTIAGGTPGYADGDGSQAQFSSPWGLAVDGQGRLFVADYGNDVIRVITPP